MNLWVKYSLLVLTCYMVWTLLWEYGIKKHRECSCMTFQILIIGGILGFLALYLHIKYECEHVKNIAECFSSTPTLIYVIILTIAMLMVISNYFVNKSVNHGGNAGTVFALANTYVVPVTLLSAYFYKTGLSTEKIIGTFVVLVGSYLIIK
jgi:uncharacterized membrane protein